MVRTRSLCSTSYFSFHLQLLYCTHPLRPHHQQFMLYILCQKCSRRVSHNLLWFFILFPALYSPLQRDIQLFSSHLSQHAGLNCCPGWTLVGGPSLSLSCQCVFCSYMRRTVLLSQVFYTSMKMLYKLLNCHITIESSRFYVFLSWRKKQSVKIGLNCIMN